MTEANHFGYGVNEYIEKARHLEYETATSKKSKMQRFCMGIDKGLTLIGTRPFMGGSEFAVSMALELAQVGARVLYISRANRNIPEILAHNYISSKLGDNFPIPPNTKEDNAKYNALTHEMRKVLLYCKDSACFRNMQELHAFLLEDVWKHSVDYVFIDCIQDLNTDFEQHVGMTSEEYICKRLRDISSYLDVRIIALANLNPIQKEPEDSMGRVFVPHIEDLRGGDLANFARKVYLLTRPEFYHVNASRGGEDFTDKMYVYIGGGSTEDAEIFEYNSKSMKFY